MSLTSENVCHTPDTKKEAVQGDRSSLFIRPDWFGLDALVTSLLDIDAEPEKFRAAMKHDMRLIALSALSVGWSGPAFEPYREADSVLSDMQKACL